VLRRTKIFLVPDWGAVYVDLEITVSGEAGGPNVITATSSPRARTTDHPSGPTGSLQSPPARTSLPR
jgi:hypothetical protein